MGRPRHRALGSGFALCRRLRGGGSGLGWAIESYKERMKVCVFEVIQFSFPKSKVSGKSITVT